MEQRWGVECRMRRSYSSGIDEASASCACFGDASKAAASEEEIGAGEKAMLYYEVSLVWRHKWEGMV